MAAGRVRRWWGGSEGGGAGQKVVGRVRRLVLKLLEGVPGSPRTTKKKEGQEMPRLSLLACNAECHHANAEAEPPGMSGGQGKDETKGEQDWR